MKIIQLLLILIVTSTAMAQHKIQPTVDVAGEGVVHVVPDEATISVRVENTGSDTQELKRLNDATINEVLKFLKKIGIADKDVKTEYMNVNKNYDYNTKTYSFAANQSLSVKVRDLNSYEAIMKGLMDSGINRVDGIRFSSSKKEILESQARKKAIENAKMKAMEYAGVLNQTVGKAVSISEFRNSNPQPMYKSAMMSMDAEAGGQQSISVGEMEVKTTVNVSFILN